MRRFYSIAIVFLGFRLLAAEVIPPAPAHYFNDYAQVVSSATALQLNQTLEDFEKQSSDQILVAVFPKMQSDSSIEDYTVRVARAWQAGQKEKNNGAVLFVFVQDHKMFVQVGYGLEAVLPDALCKRIIDEQISPRFKAGDFDGGLTAGVQSLIAAARGEYKGNGATVAQQQRSKSVSRRSGHSIGFILIVILLIIFSRRSGMFLPWMLLSSMGSSRNWGGGGFSGGSGGGFGGGGGDGFSGGGGSFGGGGAGGSW